MSLFLRLIVLFATLVIGRAALAADPPVVFVHGNGDSAATWKTVIWRFESNGYERKFLHAIDFANPLARSDDTRPQESRSSTEDQKNQLAAFVAEVKRKTGAPKVALVGNSRGGNTIRNYVKNGGGAAHVSHVVLGGAVSHGVFAADANLGSEFNGKGPFMTGLNSGPHEVVDGVAFMTLRSDNNDKYAQPDGRFIGQPGRPTGISYDAPALKGATNVVLPTLDHREVSYHWLAFAETYRFITGRAPARLDIVAEARPLLNGKVSGMVGNAHTNLPVAGAVVTVWQIDPSIGGRGARPTHRKTTGADGLWGPMRATPTAFYEFVVETPGHPTQHVYRSPFWRGTEHLHFRPTAMTDDDRRAGSAIMITRPRGYFGHKRDEFTIDGRVPTGIGEGVPGDSRGTLRLPAGNLRAVKALFNAETLMVTTWPASENRLVIAEFHH